MKNHEAHQKNHSNHKNHHEMMIEDFKKRFWICLILSIPIILLSDIVNEIFGLMITFPGDKIILLILSSIIYFYGGKPFFIGSAQELSKYRPGMMTLVAFAITVAYIYSLSIAFGLLKGQDFFWELATLIDVMLLGHWIEMRSVLGASKALEKLAALLPSQVHLVHEDGSIEDIPISKLKKGDKVLIRPGEKIPGDGIVISGESEVNEAALTGESLPVYKKKESRVIGGSLNENGSLIVLIEKDQKQNYINQVIKLIKEVMESKSHAQDLADKAAFGLTIISISAGILTFILWIIFSGNMAFALERTTSVIVIACPHALGLAIPLVIAVITTLAAQNGLLIRNRRAFEDAHNLEMVVFDKTGTLTKGSFEITDVLGLEKLNYNEILRIASAIEQYSKHSISIAIVKKAQQQNIKIPQAESVKTMPGKGVEGIVENNKYFIGNKLLMIDIGIQKEKIDRVIELSKKFYQEGNTVVFFATSGEILGIIAAADVIREESYIACKKLKERNIKIAMITGDNYTSANAVAKKLGIEVVLAEVLPHQKAEEIQKISKQGIKVAMVGDGINDAPALVAADIGIAIGAGTDIAIESADVILVKNDPSKVVELIDLSKLTKNKMIQNLLWATGYNIIALPIAAGILYKYGIMINPAIGALFMSLSTVIVAINSRLIFYKK